LFVRAIDRAKRRILALAARVPASAAKTSRGQVESVPPGG
jgi:hypothetical protein